MAWYGHLKHRSSPLLITIPISWMIAPPEYCFQVPANRIGYGSLSAFQLKIIQEIITLTVFVVFAWLYLDEPMHWRYAGSFVSYRRRGLRVLGKRLATCPAQLLAIGVGAVPPDRAGRPPSGGVGKRPAQGLGLRASAPPTGASLVLVNY